VKINGKDGLQSSRVANRLVATMLLLLQSGPSNEGRQH